jgi:hypothetical protein
LNAERLHAVLLQLGKELASPQFLPFMQQLTTALQNQVNQPGNASFQQTVAQSLATLHTFLASAASNSFSPAWRQILKEIGVADLLGNTLDASLVEVFARNQITPTIALQEIQQINQRLAQLKPTVDQLVAGFKSIGVTADELPPGVSEVGVVIPRAAVENKLDPLANELHELNLMLGDFQEIATGRRDGFEIRSISSTDFAFFVRTAPSVAAFLALAVERIVKLYKTLLEIRQLHAELAARGVSKADLQGVENHANKLMRDGIEKLIVEVPDRYFVTKDSSRKNELKNSLRITLNRWANRIDRGYNVEVRIEPPKGAKPEDAVNESVKIIREASETLQFIRLEGSPILSLPESPPPPKDTPKKGETKK